MQKVMGRSVIILLATLCMFNCVDPFEIQTDEFERSVVIEGTITDQNETQKILISQTFPLDTVLMSGLSNAQVSVSDSNGAIYSFTEANVGEYTSTSPFAAQAGLSYTLRVETSDGRTYISEETPVPSTSSIENIYAERDFKDEVEEGMFIYVDSYDPSGESKYYRFEYEETYKIIAPFWNAGDVNVIAGYPNPQFSIVPRSQEEQICYNTIKSNTIIQENTTNFSEDRISKFPVRFINRDNYILTHRYSILVKQFVQSRAAFAYYETLEKLSGSESLFSQFQTGFVEGNIYAEANSDEKVIGFFQVSTVAEGRIFFDYDDFFPGERLPDFVSDCPLLSPPVITEGGISPLLDAVEQDLITYYEDYYPPENGLIQTEPHGPYYMVYRVCGDCTALGDNTVPDFWVED